MRKFRWLFVSLLVAAALCATMFFTACGGPPGLVDWQLQRTFPHLAITIREMQWHGTGDLEVRHVEIRNRENRVLMGRVESIRITFGLRGVFSSRLSSLEIRNPVFWVTPDFVSAVEKTLDDLGGNGDAGAGREWQVDHARCDFGQFVIRNVPNEGLYGSLRFALDWKGLGNTPETLMNFHQLVVWGISVSDRTDFSHPFFTLDLLKAGFTIPRLLERRNIEEITVTGGTFRADHETFELLATPSKDDGESGEATPRVPEEPVGWIGKLSIANFVVDLDEPVPDAGAGFVFTLNTSLQNVPMGGVLHAVGSETQQVELANIEILSPLDPLVRVISLRSVFVYFSIDGLLERKLQRVIVLSPTLYLSQDFFLYMQTMREALDARTGTADRQEADGPSWMFE